MDTIDVPSRVITDWRDEKPKNTWKQNVFHYGFVVPMALIGMFTGGLWLASACGIGHFVLYYGAKPFGG